MIDYEDYNKMCTNNKSWYQISNYIGYLKKNMAEGKSTVYLHNLICNEPNGMGKGAKQSIDHINRITFDNRKCNLRKITQSQQNLNTKNRERTTDYRAHNILDSEVPRGMSLYFEKKKERFAIEMKLKGKLVLQNNEINNIGKINKFCKFNKGSYYFHLRGTAKSCFSIRDKLELTKFEMLKFRELYGNFLEDNNKYYETESVSVIQSIKDYNNIINLTNFNCKKENLSEVPIRLEVKVREDLMSDLAIKYMEKLKKIPLFGKKNMSFPIECDIDPQMIPVGVYYSKPVTNRCGGMNIDKANILYKKYRLAYPNNDAKIPSKFSSGKNTIEDNYRLLLKNLETMYKLIEKKYDKATIGLDCIKYYENVVKCQTYMESIKSKTFSLSLNALIKNSAPKKMALLDFPMEKKSQRKKNITDITINNINKSKTISATNIVPTNNAKTNNTTNIRSKTNNTTIIEPINNAKTINTANIRSVNNTKSKIINATNIRSKNNTRSNTNNILSIEPKNNAESKTNTTLNIESKNNAGSITNKIITGSKIKTTLNIEPKNSAGSTTNKMIIGSKIRTTSNIEPKNDTGSKTPKIITGSETNKIIAGSKTNKINNTINIEPKNNETNNVTGTRIKNNNGIKTNKIVNARSKDTN